MKIGFVLDDSLDKPDGVQQYVLTLGKWMAAQGNEVHYLVGQTTRNDIKHIHSLSRNMEVRFNQNRMSIPLLANRRRITTILRQERFDVLHVQMPYSPMLAAKIITAAPVATAIVGTFHIIPYSHLEQMATQTLAWWLRPSLRRFDHIWSVSAPAQAFARHSFGIDSDVLPNVIDYAALSGKKPAKQSDDKATIVFLGRLVQRKGCQQLLQAIKHLHERTDLSQLSQKLRVVVAGRGFQEARLRQICERTDLSQIVEFRGFVAEEDKAELLRGADVAVFPSLGGESFGIVLIEAMAAGAGVVVGGNNPGYESILGEWPEALVEPKNTRQFADSLERLVKDAELRKRLHAAQQQAVRQYDVAVVGPQIIAQYETIIAKKHAA